MDSEQPRGVISIQPVSNKLHYSSCELLGTHGVVEIGYGVYNYKIVSSKKRRCKLILWRLVVVDNEMEMVQSKKDSVLHELLECIGDMKACKNEAHVLVELGDDSKDTLDDFALRMRTITLHKEKLIHLERYQDVSFQTKKTRTEYVILPNTPTIIDDVIVTWYRAATNSSVVVAPTISTVVEHGVTKDVQMFSDGWQQDIEKILQ